MQEDLLYQDEIREVVREAYAAIPAGAGRAVTERLYTPDELAGVPEAAISWALGVGNPVAHADLAPGERVLDVGCGGGIDSVLAAHAVGPSGRVTGLDLLPEMCDRARAAADAAGVGAWFEARVGEMEALPLPDASVDVVISNGVLNLSPRKSRALAEIARVLAPGGRLCIADLTVDEGELPPAVLASGAAWAGCIAGAVSERVLAKKLDRAGLADVAFTARTPVGVDDVASYPLFTDDVVDLLRRLLPAERQAEIAVSVLVRAAKPATGGAGPAPPRTAGWADALAAARPAATMALDDIPPDAVEAPGVTVRHLKQVEDVELKVLDVEAGGSTPFHTHPHAHEGVVVSGRGALRLTDRSEPLGPGAVFSVAPNEPHAIASEGGKPVRFVCLDCFID